MIEIQGLTKSYGAQHAVTELTLSVGKGEIFGLIGPNGAGKTTTIKMLATLLPPTAGDAVICGHSIRGATRDARAKIGYMPDQHGLYEGMTVADYLRFFAAAYSVPEEARERVVGQILELVELASLKDERIGELSKGTQQRISLARVLVHDPEVLFLDEPASGLDPRARIEMRELLRELKRMGKTVFISSHILPELEEVCTRAAILDHGRLVWCGRPSEGWERQGGGRRVRARLAGRQAEAGATLQTEPGVAAVRADGAEDLVVTLARPEDSPALVARALVGRGFDLVQLMEERKGLEEIFLEVTAGGTAEGAETRGTTEHAEDTENK